MKTLELADIDGIYRAPGQLVLDTVLDHVVNRHYRVETRMTLDVLTRVNGAVVSRCWALNEASLEKGTRLGVLGLVIEIEQVVYFPPQPFTPRLVEFVRNNATELGYSAMDCVSGAGHDAVYVARVAPAAMIFVPCADGISHNEIEDAEPEHLEAGCNVLLRAMLDSAGVAA